MALISFDPAKSAVLSMDLQNGIIANYSTAQAELLERAGSVLTQARKAGFMIIHVRVGFRPGMPEVSPRNLLFGAIKSSAEHRRIFEGERGAIHPAVAPHANEVVITKSRVNAFAGTDLELVLRANEIETLIMFGIATSGVVLATALHASDKDYRLFIINDCCTDSDETVHECLIGKVLRRRATVISADDFLKFEQ